VASNHTSTGSLQRMSELNNYTIEQGDPDPRDCTVIGTDGSRIGTVVDLLIDTTAMKVRQILVEPAGSTGVGNTGADASFITFDVSEVEVRPNSREVVALSYAGTGFAGSDAYRQRLYAGHTARASANEQERITRTEEELTIGKREVNRGEVRVGKHVETERVSEPVTRRREEAVVERRPVEAGTRADAATIGDAEIRVPLMEEEVVVEKRPVVKEELVIGKRVVEERDTVEAEVRREEFDIDNTADVTAGDRSRVGRKR
jgi:uncharacterized protein (TIGR02271 family)